MRRKKSLLLFLVTGISIDIMAQPHKKTDTLTTQTVNQVTVHTYLNTIKPVMPDLQGTFMYAGKKTDVVNMSVTDADISLKSGRQVFAKVPGVFVYDMDGSGNQVNIATRGLDPHRGWELNTRKDGIITNSDMYGYPASHFSMPFESIDRIEFVRGTGSLQYGAQYGGMINYVSKKPDSTRSFSFESVNTTGSYQMLSSYNAVGGTIGKISYYGYYYKKTRNGYRRGEQTHAEAQSLLLQYRPSSKLSLQMEWSRTTYLYKIPGQLTDAMFLADPRQATRNRNYFNPDIHIPSVQLQWQPSASTEIKLTSSAVLGARNSVLFDKPANINDTINTVTGAFNNRQVDIDWFNSYTTELRMMKQYSIGKYMGTLVAGLQYMNNNLHRTQLGKGTTGSDFDLTLIDPLWGRDIHLKTNNIAFFAENKWQLSKQFEMTAGIRLESGTTHMSGKISYYPDHAIPVQMKHRFPLLGLGWIYRMNDRMQLYAGWSQSYRPMVFKDLIPSSLYEKVDPNIRDSKGYNLEAGFKGTSGMLKWDITWFMLQQRNRFGTIAQTEAGQLYTYRTNTGNSLTTGAEIFLQFDWQTDNTRYSLFTSTAIMHARYISGYVKNSNNQNINIKGNQLESAPDLITRNGITLKRKGASITLQYSYTSSTYADALNTELAPANTGAVGKVPAYGILDLMSTCRITKELELRVNVNNIWNKSYFTKRPLFYPAPGVWPSDGRNFSLTVSCKL